MLTQRVRGSLSSHGFPSHLPVACGIGLLLGVAALWVSPLWMLVALAGGGLTFATLKRPEIGLLGILVATSSIVFEDRLPLIPIGIGSLHMPDVILLALLGLIALRWLVEPDFKINRTPLDLPLLAFYSAALLSTFTAVFRSSLEFRMARRAMRVVTYYLTFFVVTGLVRRDRQLMFLLRCLFLLATVVAAVMIAQFVLGESLPLLPGRVETLSTWGRSYGDITRILPPGQSLILVAFIATTVTLVLDKSRMINVLGLLQCGLLGLAVVLTFNRSFWVAASVAVLLLACLVRGQDRQRLMEWGLVALLLAAMILLAAFAEPESQGARLVRASLERLGTLVRAQTLGERSLQDRYVEYEYAVPHILPPSLIGLGMGARYRPWDPRVDWKGPDDSSGFDGRAYIHNGHLWMLLKSGLLGYLCWVWLSLAFLLRGFEYWRRIPDSEMRGIVLGFSLTYVGVLIGAIVNPMFMQWFWTPVIGIMMGVNEVVLKRVVRETSVGCSVPQQ